LFDKNQRVPFPAVFPRFFRFQSRVRLPHTVRSTHWKDGMYNRPGTPKISISLGTTQDMVEGNRGGDVNDVGLGFMGLAQTNGSSVGRPQNVPPVHVQDKRDPTIGSFQIHVAGGQHRQFLTTPRWPSSCIPVRHAPACPM